MAYEKMQDLLDLVFLDAIRNGWGIHRRYYDQI